MTAVLTICTMSGLGMFFGMPLHGAWYWIVGNLAARCARCEAADHVRQIEIDLVAGAVLHQRDAVAVANLAADRGDAHGDLGAPGDLRAYRRSRAPPGPTRGGAMMAARAAKHQESRRRRCGARCAAAPAPRRMDEVRWHTSVRMASALRAAGSSQTQRQPVKNRKTRERRSSRRALAADAPPDIFGKMKPPAAKGDHQILGRQSRRCKARPTTETMDLPAVPR